MTPGRHLAATVALLAGALAAAPAALAAGFSERELEALLAAHPVDTVAELVPLLPDELRENFTFVYQSRSPLKHRISADRPRVILFTEDGSFVVTFVTTGPERDVVETMAFDGERAAFSLRARALPAARRAGIDAAALERECARCHGEDARPVFDAYPLWPGFYGSVQDTFPDELPAARKERARYLRFLRRSANRPPYRDLSWVQGSPVSPYTDPRRFHPAAIHADEELLAYQPNTRLGMALTELNRKRIARRVMASPRFAQAGPRLVAGLLGCEDGPAAELPGEAALREAVAAEDGERLARLGIARPDRVAPRYRMQELGATRSLARIDRLSQQAGAPRSDWSMALEPGALAFYDGILPVDDAAAEHFLADDLLAELLPPLLRERPALAPLVRVRPAFPSMGYPFGNKLEVRAAAPLCAALLEPPAAQAAAPR